jgi:hypothetical protein
MGKSEHGRRGRRRRLGRASVWRWKRNSNELLRWVEFSCNCAEPIVVESIRPRVPAGVDVVELLAMLHLARAAGLGVVEAGVVGKVTVDGALKKGRALPDSWWAETPGSDGRVLGVDDCASPVDAVLALVRAMRAAAARGAARSSERT